MGPSPEARKRASIRSAIAARRKNDGQSQEDSDARGDQEAPQGDDPQGEDGLLT